MLVMSYRSFFSIKVDCKNIALSCCGTLPCKTTFFSFICVLFPYTVLVVVLAIEAKCRSDCAYSQFKEVSVFL